MIDRKAAFAIGRIFDEHFREAKPHHRHGPLHPRRRRMQLGTHRLETLGDRIETVTERARLDGEFEAPRIGLALDETLRFKGREATVDRRSREPQFLTERSGGERTLTIQDLNQLQAAQQHAHRGRMPRRHAVRTIAHSRETVRTVRNAARRFIHQGSHLSRLRSLPHRPPSHRPHRPRSRSP